MLISVGQFKKFQHVNFRKSKHADRQSVQYGAIGAAQQSAL